VQRSLAFFDSVEEPACGLQVRDCISSSSAEIDACMNGRSLLCLLQGLHTLSLTSRRKACRTPDHFVDTNLRYLTSCKLKKSTSCSGCSQSGSAATTVIVCATVCAWQQSGAVRSPHPSACWELPAVLVALGHTEPVNLKLKAAWHVFS
jgi:hypothetical protein